MRGAARTGCFVVAIGLIASLALEAQPQRGGRGERGGRGGRLGTMALRFIPVEQTLGFLAFNKGIGLTDDQLLKVRKELKTVYKKRAELMEEMQGGQRDRQAMMEKIRGLHGEMVEKLTGVLNAEQNKVLEAHMERRQNRWRRGGGRQGGGGGERL